MKYISLVAVFFIFQFSFSPAVSQVKKTGIPYISHHSKKEYRGGAQSWDFVQSDNHVLYVANNKGILSYDGLNWDQILMPNRSIVRCLFKDDDDIIYVGAYNEFGFLAPDSTGKIAYISLKHNIPETETGEYWRIYHQDEYYYFQTYDALVIFNKDLNTWTVEKPETAYGFLHQVNGQLYINQRGKGLMEINGEEFIEVLGGEIFADWEIWKMAIVRGILHVVTQNNGVFTLEDGIASPWQSEANEFLLKNRFYSFEKTRDNLFWGSIHDGLIVTNHNGDIISHFNKKSGLRNNTILSLYLDTEKTLWMGLDNGIDQVYIHSPISYLRTENEIGAGYCAAIFEGRIYLGTNQGLFWIPNETSSGFPAKVPFAKSIPECSGQVWTLKVVDNELLVGHNRGTFAIRGKTVRHIYDKSGGWNFNEWPDEKSLILQGTYNGLVFYKKGNNGLQFDYEVSGIQKSSKSIEIDEDKTIWMGHGYDGIFKITLSDDLKTVSEIIAFGDSCGLGTKNFNELFITDNGILAGNTNGIFNYVRERDDFVPADNWNNAFSDGGRMTALIHGTRKDYFYFQEESSGHLQIFADTLFIKDQGILAPLSQSYIPSFENISELGDEEFLVGTTDGFVHLDMSLQVHPHDEIPFHFKTFESLRNNSDIRVFLETKQDLDKARLGHPLGKVPFRDNDIRISFVTSSLTVPEQNYYQYNLEGQSTAWSKWSNKSAFEFTNLKEGEYLLKVRAKNAYGKTSSERVLYFHILTPWHRSTLAYISYLVILIILIIIVWKVWNKRIEKEKRRSKILEERRMLHKQLKLKRDSEIAEKEIVKLRNDKLRASVRHKSKELANQTMGVLQKNRFLTEIKEEMLIMKKKAQSDDVKNSLRKMLRKIDRNIEDEHAQKVFETNFDQVHENFLLRLREAYPDLTAKDLRLCAYLRLNLSSKEIAPLLNISIRGVEISRYRLRKKLDLNHDENLADYILRF